ncbi:MAG: hypothetical protein H6819_06025 [Phycisphaerales bacterium]|nr:hypothetical protein [Phycisphaerales bacterium]MCB9858621.1 hypothetical protein [Phycisphaerales bacterium]
MAIQRIIIRTCDHCMGTKKDPSNFSRYQWFIVIGVIIASYDSSARARVLTATGIIISIVSAILMFYSLIKPCRVCDGDGKRRVIENTYERGTDDSAFSHEQSPEPPRTDPGVT